MRIYCGTSATNADMQKLATQLVMLQEVARRRHLFLDGEWAEMLEYGVLRKEFQRRMP